MKNEPCVPVSTVYLLSNAKYMTKKCLYFYIKMPFFFSLPVKWFDDFFFFFYRSSSTSQFACRRQEEMCVWKSKNFPEQQQLIHLSLVFLLI